MPILKKDTLRVLKRDNRCVLMHLLKKSIQIGHLNLILEAIYEYITSVVGYRFIVGFRFSRREFVAIC